jgi:hypothetical protein
VSGGHDVPSELLARFNQIQIEMDDAMAKLASLREEQVALVWKAWDIKPGDKVRLRDRVYSVDAIEAHFGHLTKRPWLRGCKLKKDGTPGQVQSTIYGDWEKVS